MRKSMILKAAAAVFATLAIIGSLEQARPDFIYWNEFLPDGSILRANLDGSGQQSIVTGQNMPTGPALDVAGGKIYWINYSSSGDLLRANLDGSGQPEVLVSGLNNAGGLELDITGGKMYWTYGQFDIGGIQRANLDGSGLTTLVSGVNNPSGLTLDVPGGKMYLSDRTGVISRYNLDGSGRETILTGLSNNVRRMALDIPRGKIYWAEIGGIRRANLDGSAREEVVTRTGQQLSGIALDVARGKLYWTHHAETPRYIGRANLDGSEQETVLAEPNLRDAVGIVLQLDPIAAPVPVTGFSADVISDQDPAARFAQPFYAGTFAWFEAGAVDDSGVVHNDGLPAGQTLLSATGSRATYQIQPANANNVLQLSAGQTGTLTLTTPAAYSTLYVIASSGDGTPSSVGSGTVNFADGSTQGFGYNSFDWCNAQGRFRPEAVLTGPNGRADVGPDGLAFVYNQDCDFQVYETIIAIDPSLAGVAIASIDFTAAPDAFFSNIFGVSGR